MAGIPQVITEDRASGAQFIDGSLTIDGSNQYLTRTHTASNTKTWTFSCWVKKQRNAAYHQLFTGFSTGADQSGIIFMNDDTLRIYSQGGLSMNLTTSAVYRDSGWMNVVVAVDTTQSTAADRVKLWINGTRITSFGTATYPSQDDETYVNTNITHYVGSNQPSSNTFYGQYAQAYFIDGQALGPEEFGFTDLLTNTWRPKKYTGTFTGTNTFYLPFDGNSPIGEDKSGIVTPNNGSIWSNSLTSSSGFRSSEPKINAFDGNTSSICSAVGSGTVTFTSPVKFASNSTIRVFLHGGDHTVTVNGGSNQTISAGSFQTVTYSNSGNPTFVMTFYRGGGADTGVRAIEIDGVILTDGQIGNNWTPVNFGGSVELPKATGAIPILNTNEAGTVAKKGVRTDSKTYTVTASGGNYYLDGALTPTLNAYRGSSLTFDYTGATSHPLYLSSLPDGKHNSKAYSVQFDGTGDYLGVSGNSDFDFGTGDFTIEGYFYTTNNNGTIASSQNYYSGTGNWLIRISNATQLAFASYDGTGNEEYVEFNASYQTNTWHHFAFVRTGTTLTCYLDGSSVGTLTVSKSLSDGSNGILIGEDGGNLNAEFNGKISNFRINKGTALYTSNFTPPWTTLTNVTGTTLLCCQENNAATAAVLPTGATITANGNAAAVNSSPFLYDNNHGNFGVNTGTSNTTKITIPHWAADTLYYYCSAHSGMGSSINVTTDIRKADPYAWKNFLALPLVGSDNDVSDSVNCTSTAKVATNSSVTASSAQSNFYNGSHYWSANSDTLQYAEQGDELVFGTGDYTIECWVYDDDGHNGGGSGRCYIFDNRIGGSVVGDPPTLTGFVDGSNEFNFGYSSGTISVTVPTTVGKWWHYAVTREGTTVRFFLDGILRGSATDSTNFTNNGIGVGRATDGGYGWAGYIQDFRVYKGIAKYTSNFIPASTDPDILPDTPSGIIGKTKLTKITEGAVAFSGSYLDAGSALVNTNNSFCVEAFAYLNNNPSSGDMGMICSQYTGGLPAGRMLYGFQDGYLALRINGGTVELQSAAGSVGSKRWYHTAWTWDGTTHRLFLDGKLVDSSTTVPAPYTGTNTEIGGNANLSGYDMDGYISNFRIVTGSAVYTEDFTPPTRALTNVTNTTLLCCQSTTSASAATVAPGTFVNDGTNYSSGNQVTGSAGLANVDSLFDGHLRESGNPNLNEGATVNISSDNYILWTPTTGIPYSSKVEVYCYAANGYEITNYYTFNGGTETTFTGGSSNFNGNAWITVATGSGTINSIKLRLTRGSGNQSQVNWYAVRVDGTILINDYNGKSIGKYGNTSATNFNPFTDDINAIRGQASGYATLNPNFGVGRQDQLTYSDGNLTVKSAATTGNDTTAVSTLAVKGKIYCEFALIDDGVGAYVGVMKSNTNLTNNGIDTTGSSDCWLIRGDSGNKVNGSLTVSYGSVFATGDLIMMAVDIDNTSIWWGKNGVWFASGNPATNSNAAYTNLPSADDLLVMCGDNYSSETPTIGVNFGQKPFKFPPPDGFQPLNLSTVQPEKVIARPDQYVDVSLWSGNGTSQSITGLKHKPDFVWIKKRAGGSVRSHQLFDSVRGVYKTLHSNSTSVEDSNTNRLTAFNQDGFSVGGDDGSNGSSGTFVGWSWKAGGDKNTFNIDDVGYANASDVNMNVGVLNSSLYNTSRVWSSGIANSSGDFDQAATNAFNGDHSNRLRTGGNSVLVTLNFSPALTVNSTVEIRAITNTTADFRYTVTVDGTTTTKDVNQGQPATFNVSGSLTQITFDNNNSNGRTYLEWIKVDGKELIDSNVTINTPSIAPTGCSVGTKQGFSIVKWTGDGSDANRTVPHGLLEAPSFIIVKPLTEARHWLIWHKGYNDDAAMLFDTGIPAGSRFGPAAPTSNVFGVYGGQGNRGTTDFIGYCWHDVPGLQKFGTYTGNGDFDGPFVELGFQPAIIWMKNISNGSNRHWCVVDSTRTEYNKSGSCEVLFFDSDQIESRPDDGFGQFGNKTCIDISSNGFKLREPNSTGVWTQVNNTDQDYIYCAWAEVPSINLYGAQSNAF